MYKFHYISTYEVLLILIILIHNLDIYLDHGTKHALLRWRSPSLSHQWCKFPCEPARGKLWRRVVRLRNQKKGALKVPRKSLQEIQKNPRNTVGVLSPMLRWVSPSPRETWRFWSPKKETDPMLTALPQPSCQKHAPLNPRHVWKGNAKQPRKIGPRRIGPQHPRFIKTGLTWVMGSGVTKCWRINFGDAAIADSSMVVARIVGNPNLRAALLLMFVKMNLTSLLSVLLLWRALQRQTKIRRALQRQPKIRKVRSEASLVGMSRKLSYAWNWIFFQSMAWLGSTYFTVLWVLFAEFLDRLLKFSL